MRSLQELEGMAGINILTPLAEKHTKVMLAAGVTLSKRQRQKLAACETNIERLEIVIDQWKSGSSDCPRTWIELLAVLEDLDLMHLVYQITNYFGKYNNISTVLAS